MTKRLHLGLSWLFALPLIWIAITGALLGFSAETDRIMHVELMTTPMSQQPTLPEAVQRERIQQAFPDAELIAFSPAKNPVDTSMAQMKDQQGELWQVFLNPKLGEINGKRPLAEDWSVVLSQWHRFAFLGDSVGRGLIALSSIVLLLVLLSGWMQSSGKSQAVYSLHRLVGQWLTPLLVVLVVSGILLWLHHSQWMQTGVDWVSIHQGDWLGLPGRLLWVVASVSLAWLIIGGLWLASTHKKDY